MVIPEQVSCTTLAQASTTSVLLWLGVLIVLILGGAIAAVWIRRSYHASETHGAPLESLSLHQLRQLHARGAITDEELETLKQIAVRAHSSPGPAPHQPTPTSGGRRAEPGCDLTGEPLPGASDPGSDPPGENKSGPDASPRPEA